MSWPMRPARSYLYVPGSEPTRIQKALASAADAVVLDLEDAVAPSQKVEARANVAGALRAWAAFPRPGKTLWVRINTLNSALAEDDIAAVSGPGLSGVRIPRVESPEEVRQIAAWLARAGTQVAMQCLIEIGRAHV